MEPDSKQNKPSGDTVDENLKAALLKRAPEGRLACAVAFKLTEELQLPPAEIGRMADTLNIRLTKCQMGLFGYGKTNKEKKLTPPPESIKASIQSAVKERLTDGKLCCIDAWEIASRLKIHKMAVSGFCEEAGIKVKNCQLGAF